MIEVKPIFQPAIADDPAATAAGEVTPTRYNQGSQITMASGYVLGRVSVGDGEAEEVALAAVAYDGLSSSLTNDAGFITSAGAPVQSVSGKTGVVTLVAGDVGLGSVTNDAQTKAAIVPNTAPSAGQFLAGNAGGTAYAPVSMSGDATLASTGAITVTQARGLLETAGPTTLAMGAVADGELLKRSGTTIVGASPGAATVDIEDDGTPEGAADTIDFTGAGVSVTFAAGKATVTIPGGSSSGPSIGLVMALRLQPGV